MLPSFLISWCLKSNTQLLTHLLDETESSLGAGSQAINLNQAVYQRLKCKGSKEVSQRFPLWTHYPWNYFLKWYKWYLNFPLGSFSQVGQNMTQINLSLMSFSDDEWTEWTSSCYQASCPCGHSDFSPLRCKFCLLYWNNSLLVQHL